MKQTRIKDFSHAPMDDLRQERSDLYSVAHALGARAPAITAKADEMVVSQFDCGTESIPALF
jgi:DNA-directed RNA polymerase subunit K/omega